MSWSSVDHMAMARAIQLASRASCYVHPNPRVGCVFMRGDRIIAEGWHERAGAAHAEIMAIDRAREDLRDSACYITLEPCAHTGKTPPCVDALIKTGINSVTVAMTDPNPRVDGRGLARLEVADIQTRSGLLQAQAERLNPGFLKRARHGLPYVRCKMAMSLDGRTALANGASRWISSEAARRDVHGLRARSSAIVTGIGTVRADDPAMTVRAVDSDGYQPLRVVMDSNLQISPGAAIHSADGPSLVFTAGEFSEKTRHLEQAGVTVVTATGTDGQVDLRKALATLAGEFEINDVLLEAGPCLSGSMIRQGLVDELVIYLAPRLLGNSARGVFELPVFEHLEECIQLDISDIRTIGPDVRITAQLNTRVTDKAS